MTETGISNEPTDAQRRGMRGAIIGQSLGGLAEPTFEAGLIVLYLTSLGLAPARVLLYVSLPWFFVALGLLPAAFAGDRFGKKRVGAAGLVMSIVGFAMLVTAGFFPDAAGAMAAVGIAIYGLGMAMRESTWFALLGPVVPEAMRGRFFGLLRLLWRLSGVVFLGACAFALSDNTPVATFQIVLGAVTAAMFIRLYYYMQIPELETDRPPIQNIPAVVMSILRSPGIMSFGSYIFLRSLVATGAPALFALLEKNVLGFGDNQVAWVGTLFMVGAIPGYWLGGRMVDRYSPRPVFLFCHFSIAAVYSLFLFRGWMPLPEKMGLLILAGAANLAFGFNLGASSVAISTETLALIPKENKSVATSIIRLLQRIGGALSGALAAWVLDTGMLSEKWNLFGKEVSQYDAVLLTWGILIVLFVVTLGLVPSVIGKAQWLPRSE